VSIEDEAHLCTNILRAWRYRRHTNGGGGDADAASRRLVTRKHSRLANEANSTQSPDSPGPSAVKIVFNSIGLAAALAALVVGSLLLWSIWRGKPVAAAFTRVGGATRIETALQASRFWLKPLQYVVVTRAYENEAVMLGAARCAMVRDAPLLFNSANLPRRQLARATAKALGRSAAHVVWVPDLTKADSCLKAFKSADVADLSLLHITYQPEIRHPAVQPGPTLARMVVFAAALAPGDEPDVAVGMALAAHLARQQPVSLVVVPRYLEADPSLEADLGKQRELVTSGVVLGQTPTVPEDTSLLLRQLITAPDRQGWLAQLQANLGGVAPVVAALLAIVGLGTVTRVAPEMEPQFAALIHVTGDASKKAAGGVALRMQSAWRATIGAGKSDSNAKRKRPKKGPMGIPKNAPVRAALLAGLRKDQEVIVWLSSGWKVTGKVGELDDALLVLPVEGAKLEQHNQSAQHERVLVPVEDIQLIDIGGLQKRNETEPMPANETAPNAT
jgi:hypothetical protein